MEFALHANSDARPPCAPAPPPAQQAPGPPLPPKRGSRVKSFRKSGLIGLKSGPLFLLNLR
jgi:hypothetical protein